jgi:hypothetical protein
MEAATQEVTPTEESVSEEPQVDADKTVVTAKEKEPATAEAE